MTLWPCFVPGFSRLTIASVIAPTKGFLGLSLIAPWNSSEFLGASVITPQIGKSLELLGFSVIAPETSSEFWDFLSLLHVSGILPPAHELPDVHSCGC